MNRGSVPIIVEAAPLAPAAARDRHDAVLIDDDPLTRMTWKMTAARLGKKLRSFESVADFLKESDGIDRATRAWRICAAWSARSLRGGAKASPG